MSLLLSFVMTQVAEAKKSWFAGCMKFCRVVEEAILVSRVTAGLSSSSSTVEALQIRKVGQRNHVFVYI